MNREKKLCDMHTMKPLPISAESIYRSFRFTLTHRLGRFLGCRKIHLFQALASVIRDHLMVDWHNTWQTFTEPGTRRACYISMEFLIGRSLSNHMLNIGAHTPTEKVIRNMSLNLEEIEAKELDAGLGNGGLGRLAACFMDSCATLRLPIIGYGIRYEYGMFHQHIENGYQIEDPDHWLRDGYPWEIERQEYTQAIKFGGRCEHYVDGNNRQKTRWIETDDVLAIPYDVPVSGYRNKTINTLRLWKAEATEKLNLNQFNVGSYTEAVATKNEAEHITTVLYPNDSSQNGKELRLRQQYFLASASLQDAIQIWEGVEDIDYDRFIEQNVFHMNDTHPSIAVAELMRILIDEKDLDWDAAWHITRHCMAYTNHTLLPEALERWPVSLFECLLPRLLEIIYQINEHFLREISLRWPGDIERLKRVSIIEETPIKQVRMAHLAIIGSFSVNGVAELHSRLLTQNLFRDFYEIWPEKFNNKTNGVTPRRWLAYANPALTRLLNETIGDAWVSDLSQINTLTKHADTPDDAFIERWQAVKLTNKRRLIALVKKKTGICFSDDAMLSVQVKRIHEYKRQLLNILHIIHLYVRIKHGRTDGMVKRCFLIGGKAAPGYWMAKQIIKLINNVASIINEDPDIGDYLKLAFLPNYKVSSMEVIAPGADLSEQISTAGKEASGTGNMKFMMNGALTIGTYDGANIEILNAVGKDNFFLFGLHAEAVDELKQHYHPQSFIDADQDLKNVIDLLSSDFFNPVEPGIFDEILNTMLSPNDPWVTIADFRSYVNAQETATQAWKDSKQWTLKSIRNVAACGYFSTDRTIRDYNDDIWKLTPLDSSQCYNAGAVQHEQ